MCFYILFMHVYSFIDYPPRKKRISFALSYSFFSFFAWNFSNSRSRTKLHIKTYWKRSKKINKKENKKIEFFEIFFLCSFICFPFWMTCIVVRKSYNFASFFVYFKDQNSWLGGKSFAKFLVFGLIIRIHFGMIHLNQFKTNAYYVDAVTVGYGYRQIRLSYHLCTNTYATLSCWVRFLRFSSRYFCSFVFFFIKHCCRLRFFVLFVMPLLLLLFPCILYFLYINERRGTDNTSEW